ncbi:MAG: uroporphyrinogen-III synthase [Bacteroidales bacterium]|nr:uroporphyrinogen-III synthase [Bacteroidales bacterium]
MKIRKILVTQPEPENEKSPFRELAAKNNVKVEFRPFSHVEGLSARDIRQARIDILEHTALVFSAKTAIDHFFRICEEMRITVPDSMKYFCTTESVAFYLQKYIVYRKRKIYYGKNSLNDIQDALLKNKEEKFLIPLSDNHKNDIPELLDRLGLKYTKAIFYRTVTSDLSDLTLDYDILVFYSPAAVKALLENFPNFEQKDIKIASFGEATAKAVKEAGLRLDIQAPVPEAPSMTMALDLFIRNYNKNCKGTAK